MSEIDTAAIRAVHPLRTYDPDDTGYRVTACEACGTEDCEPRTLCDALDAARAELDDSRANDLRGLSDKLTETLARAEKAEAAIARVRALTDYWLRLRDVIAALDGETP